MDSASLADTESALQEDTLLTPTSMVTPTSDVADEATTDVAVTDKAASEVVVKKSRSKSRSLRDWKES